MMVIPVWGMNFALSATCMYHIYVILASYAQVGSK